MTTFGALTYPEITAQPEAVAKALEQVQAQQDWVGRFIANDKYDEVIFIGSGSSYYQALTMAATYRRWTGRRASALPSSEIYLFRDAHTAAGRTYLLVGVSRSGESSEVILALNAVKELPDWEVCGITCYETSTMAGIGPCLVSPLGKEQSTVMTKSFSSMTYMMQAASAIASGDAALLEEMKRTAQLSADTVKRADEFANSFVNGHDLNKFIYLGMGGYLGLAHEACLKLKEMSYVWTESFGTLEFRHGPKSVVEPGTLVCLLVSEQARGYELKVAEEMKGYGATVLLVVGTAGADTAFADAVFETGGEGLSDEARSVLYMPVLQYVGYYTALKRNVDPDHPRNLTQVVII